MQAHGAYMALHALWTPPANFSQFETLYAFSAVSNPERPMYKLIATFYCCVPHYLGCAAAY